MGIGPLPVSAALQGFLDGTLVPVLPRRRLRPDNIYAIYASRQFLDAKIRTFVDFLQESVPEALTQNERELQEFEGSVYGNPVISKGTL
jgi:DNA-binding transcriptional LysR family regulator